MRMRVGLLAALLTVSVWAKPEHRLVQSHYNAQVQVQNFSDLSRKVDELSRECQAQITSFNCDANNCNGNLNARVPDDKLTRFTEGLRKLGVVRSENRSMSDNTSSYLDAQRNLQMAEKTLSAQWTVTGSNLTATEKGLVDAEFRAYLRDRINSYRSTMNSYEQNQGFAEVSVSLSGAVPPEQQRSARPSRGTQVLETTQIEEIAPASPAISPQLVGMMIFAPACTVFIVLALYLMKQKRSQAPDLRRPQND